MGFLGASRATIESEFGNVQDAFSYDNVDCYGTEDALDDCAHLNEDEENCVGNEAAGVVCIGGSSSTTTESSSPPGSSAKCFILKDFKMNNLLFNWEVDT